MDNLFSDRISDVPKSFIREILKVAVDEATIEIGIERLGEALKVLLEK